MTSLRAYAVEGGAARLLDYAKGLGVSVDTDDCYSTCGVCRKLMSALTERWLN